MYTQIVRFVVQDQGVDLIEYALLAGLLSLACFAVLQSIGTSINTMFTNLSTKLGTVLP